MNNECFLRFFSSAFFSDRILAVSLLLVRSKLVVLVVLLVDDKLLLILLLRLLLLFTEFGGLEFSRFLTLFNCSYE